MSDEKNKGGRPQLDIDPEQVRRLAQIQCPVTEIAAFFGCDPKTIYNRFSTEIEKGRENGKTKLRQAQYQTAMSGNVSMQIWLGKQLLGQTDKSQIEQAEAVEIFVRYGERNKDGDDGEANKET